MKINFSVFVSLILIGNLAFATFVPEDQLIDSKLLPRGPSNITEQEFNQVFAELTQVYGPIVATHGGKLVFQGDWKGEKANAQANQQFGQWIVRTTGGLARRPELTRDGFQLIMCHELGHHLGGFPFSPAMPIPIPVPVPGVEVWAATEGQSDYFATQVCARRMWASETAKNAEHRKTSSDENKSYCDAIWDTEADQNLCYRVLAATESMLKTMTTLMGKEMPKFSTPDQTKIGKTDSKHPAPQCRLDTSLQGALCDVLFNNALIPGKKVTGGTESVEAEKEAMMNSCSSLSSHTVGLRPACWFKGRM